MIKVAIVILNWNRKEETLECLKSIQQLKANSYQLTAIVVDNGSTDRSVEAFRKLKTKDSKLVILENKKNLGYAGGNNVGVRYALDEGADFILILNNDTIVANDLLVQLVKAADKYKDAGIFSPKIYFAKGFEFHYDRYKENERGKVIWYAGGIIDWNNVLGANRGVDEVDHGQYDSPTEADFATGACMFVRREVFGKIGFFDERYFLYLEDVDFSVRTRHAGWKIMYTPKAYLWHKVGRSSGIGSDLADYYLTRNRLFFGVKYAPFRSKLALLRESLKFLVSGRRWQRRGVVDFYIVMLGKGSYGEK